MNHCLAQIGIEHPEHRQRAVDVGERLQVFSDHPTPPGCTSPSALLWIAEIVRRRAVMPSRSTGGAPAPG